MPQTFYEVVWIFFIYAFIGWCTEVAYAALERGVFVNRGFLNGPYCPIYGCGVLIVVAILTPLKKNLLLLFLGSFLLTSVLEFLTGFLMEKIFHNKWWDYSDKPFNLMGYVCLEFSVLWGLACTFILLIIHPLIYGFIRVVPHILGIVLLILFMLCFAVDLSVTVSTIVKFNKRLKLMNEIAAKLKIISNEIGENVYENVMEALEKKEEFSESVDKFKTGVEYNKLFLTAGVKESVDEAKAKLRREQEELLGKYRELYNKKSGSTRRLLKAFPGMKSRDYNDILQKLRKRNLEK